MAAVTDFFPSNTTHTTQLLQRILWETKKKAKPLTGEETLGRTFHSLPSKKSESSFGVLLLLLEVV